MVKFPLRYIWVFIGVLLTGCGTFATPVWQVSTPIAVTLIAQANIQPPIRATETPTRVPPTHTSEPTPTYTATSSPTVEPTSTPATSPIERLVMRGDVENGEILFTTFQGVAGFACSTCHRADSEDRLIGPGLLNIANRATERVEETSAVDYVYNSIVNPDEYVVEGFPDGLMPQNWSEIYSTSEIIDIVAYLMSLEGDATVTKTIAEVESDQTASNTIVLPDSANPEHGQELFNTFQPAASFACATCHRADSEDRLIGPGLLNVSIRAESRVDGLDATQYIYQSIVNPSTYVVDGFPDQLMPQNWADIYSDEEIFDIIAYLFTLEG